MPRATSCWDGLESGSNEELTGSVLKKPFRDASPLERIEMAAAGRDTGATG